MELNGAEPVTGSVDRDRLGRSSQAASIPFPPLVIRLWLPAKTPEQWKAAEAQQRGRRGRRLNDEREYFFNFWQPRETVASRGIPSEAGRLPSSGLLLVLSRKQEA